MHGRARRTRYNLTSTTAGIYFLFCPVNLYRGILQLYSIRYPLMRLDKEGSSFK